MTDRARESVIQHGPKCEGCGEHTREPTWFEMDPFCPACVDDLKGEHGDYGVLNPGTRPVEGR